MIYLQLEMFSKKFHRSTFSSWWIYAAAVLRKQQVMRLFFFFDTLNVRSPFFFVYVYSFFLCFLRAMCVCRRVVFIWPENKWKIIFIDFIFDDDGGGRANTLFTCLFPKKKKTVHKKIHFQDCVHAYIEIEKSFLNLIVRF